MTRLGAAVEQFNQQRLLAACKLDVILAPARLKLIPFFSGCEYLGKN